MQNIELARHSLYSEVTSCPLHCAGITNNRRDGIIPRSFFWGEASSSVSLLVVSKNPGNGPTWESDLYVRTPDEELVSVHLGVVSDLFNGIRSLPSRYHDNLVRRVAAVLGIAAKPAEVFRYAAMTALAKCQSSGQTTSTIPGQTFSTCAERYLFREIALFKPVYLLALGNETYNFLMRPSIAAQHRLKVGRLWHPSRSNMPGGEDAYFANELPSLNVEHTAALRSHGRSCPP